MILNPKNAGLKYGKAKVSLPKSFARKYERRRMERHRQSGRVFYDLEFGPCKKAMTILVGEFIGKKRAKFIFYCM